MGRIKTIARRSFLIGSAAVTGGVMFGYYSYKKTVENPLLKDLATGAAALTPYVLIDQSGITLITPRADVGQGAYAVQAALIAEELDLRLDQLRVNPGVPSAAYYNGKVAAEGFPIAATNESVLGRSGRAMGDVAGKLLGLQVTGGSSTVPDAYEKLRIAGAVARATLLAAAAQKAHVDVANLNTRDGAVVFPDGTSISYLELAPIAATIEPVIDVVLKPTSNWRYLGKKMQRIDIVAKSTGAQNYGIDMILDGMVFATVRTNPHIGGGVISYDDSAAKAMRGVQKIVPITGGIGVIADNTWRAFQAAHVVDFNWGAAPYPQSSDDMWAVVGDSFTKTLQDSQFKDDGDVDAALAGLDVLQAEYRIPYLAHAPLEPMTATVLLTDNRLDIWTATQMPIFMQANAAKLTGLDADDVHVHVLMAGGSFGRRLEDDYVQQAIEIAQFVKGTPVKMTWEREQDMTHDFPRPMQMSRARGTVKNRQVVAFDLAIAAQSVTASQLSRLHLPALGPDMMIVAGAWDQPFSIPNYRVTGYRVPEMVPVSSWRSVGASGNGFLHDCFLDELIHAAGADPLAERLRLCWHGASRKVLETVGEMSNWGSELGLRRGRGIAFTLSFGVPCAQVIEVTDTPGGIRIDQVYVAAEVGRILDPVNFENQVQGGVIWGLSHAVFGELSFADGMAEQSNFDTYEVMRMYQTPEIMVRGLENGEEIRGIGEPPVPPAAAALANAIFAATGKRIREMPLNKHIDFV